MIERILPRDQLAGWYKFRPYGMLILLLILFTGTLGRIITPFLNHLYRFVLR
jgi:hypothetical protein